MEDYAQLKRVESNGLDQGEEIMLFIFISVVAMGLFVFSNVEY